MKKSLILGTVAALALMAVPSSALTLDESTCTVLSDPDVGFDAALAGVVALIDLVNSTSTLFPILDYEAMPGGVTGDGIADPYQMALIAAVLCSPVGTTDPVQNIALMKTQHQANIDTFNNQFLPQIGTISNNVVAAVPLLISIGNGLKAIPALQTVTVRSLVPSWPNTTDTVWDLADELIGFAGEIQPYISVIQALPSMFGQYAPAMAAMMGMSTEMQGVLDQLMGLVQELLADVVQYQTAAQQLIAVYGPPPGNGTISVALTNDINTLISYLNITINVPTFEVLGASGQPILGTSHWSGSSATNRAIYDAVVAVSGQWNMPFDPLNPNVPPYPNATSRQDFVAAVTGDQAWYGTRKWFIGNPALPAVGLIGLGLLGAAVAAGGAGLLRKRS